MQNMLSKPHGAELQRNKNLFTRHRRSTILDDTLRLDFSEHCTRATEDIAMIGLSTCRIKEEALEQTFTDMGAQEYSNMTTH